MKILHLSKKILDSEKSSGVILIFITIFSIVMANSSWQATYLNIWHFEMVGHSITHWINDGLMAIFFLLIGLELEREIYQGELSTLKNASLPIFGAIGGMIVPAGIFLLLNYGTPTQAGAGIPMATDIAFAVGILSLLGSRIPISLKIFLTALAVIDDLGAIIVIALFYTATINSTYLFIAISIYVFLIILNRLKVLSLIPYILGGIAMWFFMLHSGIHATITGVMIAFAVPFGDKQLHCPSLKLQHFLHKPVIFLILPLFAVANTSIPLGQDWISSLTENNSLGIIAGLVLGKPLGILIFSIIGVKLGLSALPHDLKWKNIIGAGFLCGIGFTMSIFISILAFNPLEGANITEFNIATEIINNSKIAILFASILAGTIGFIYLRLTFKNPNKLV